MTSNTRRILPPLSEDGSFFVGDKVEARSKGGAKYFAGRITSKNRDGTYDIKYNDGDEERNIPARSIKSLPDDTGDTALDSPADTISPTPDLEVVDESNLDRHTVRTTYSSQSQQHSSVDPSMFDLENGALDECGFTLKIFALNRQGAKLLDSFQLSWNSLRAEAETTPLFEMKIGEHMQSRDIHEVVDLELTAEELDAELETKLLQLGRPLPCEVAMYGRTWCG